MNDKSLKCHWFVWFSQSACLLAMWQIEFFICLQPSLCVYRIVSDLSHSVYNPTKQREKTPTMTNLNVCDESMKWQTQEKEEEKRVVNTMGFVFVLRLFVRVGMCALMLYISNTMGNETTNKICLFNVTQTCEHTKIKYDKPKSVSA